MGRGYKYQFYAELSMLGGIWGESRGAEQALAWHSPVSCALN